MQGKAAAGCRALGAGRGGGCGMGAFKMHAAKQRGRFVNRSYTGMLMGRRTAGQPERVARVDGGCKWRRKPPNPRKPNAIED